MSLPIDRLLRTEPDVRILPHLWHGGIDPSDVVLLHLGDDGGIFLASPSDHGDACRLAWRLLIPAGLFDEMPATVDEEMSSSGWLAIDLVLDRLATLHGSASGTGVNDRPPCDDAFASARLRDHRW